MAKVSALSVADGAAQDTALSAVSLADGGRDQWPSIDRVIDNRGQDAKTDSTGAG
jgi:hypothetical protein